MTYNIIAGTKSLIQHSVCITTLQNSWFKAVFQALSLLFLQQEFNLCNFSPFLYFLPRFLAVNAGVVYAYFAFYQHVEEEEFGGTWELLKEGFITSFALFLVSHSCAVYHDNYYNLLASLYIQSCIYIVILLYCASYLQVNWIITFTALHHG